MPSRLINERMFKAVVVNFVKNIVKQNVLQLIGVK